jgi:hypothetical protein
VPDVAGVDRVLWSRRFCFLEARVSVGYPVPARTNRCVTHRRWVRHPRWSPRTASARRQPGDCHPRGWRRDQRVRLQESKICRRRLHRRRADTDPRLGGWDFGLILGTPASRLIFGGFLVGSRSWRASGSRTCDAVLPGDACSLLDQRWPGEAAGLRHLVVHRRRGRLPDRLPTWQRFHASDDGARRRGPCHRRCSTMALSRCCSSCRDPPWVQPGRILLAAAGE